MSKFLKLPVLTEKDKTRFWSHISKQQGCWPWKTEQAAKYPRFSIGGRKGNLYLASRIAFLLYYGFDPGDFLVLHGCDNPRCCNPDHLRLGTYQDNTTDREDRQRGNHVTGEQHGLTTLTNKDVIQILQSDDTCMSLALRYHVSDVTIGNIRRGITWKHVAKENSL
jgi:hypothetical protein